MAHFTVSIKGNWNRWRSLRCAFTNSGETWELVFVEEASVEEASVEEIGRDRMKKISIDFADQDQSATLSILLDGLNFKTDFNLSSTGNEEYESLTRANQTGLYSDLKRYFARGESTASYKAALLEMISIFDLFSAS